MTGDWIFPDYHDRLCGYSISGIGHETWCTGLYRKTCQPGRIIKENIRSSTNRENANSSFRSQDVFEKVSPASSKETTETRRAYLEGESDAAKQLYNYVGLVAPTNMSVLINGSSGTGKEYVAHRIHQLSKRSDKPFIAVDCGSIPKELAASEFFGHVKGSFTGALTDKTGAFVAANGGTIFLDEIGNLSYEVQIQLLRALQERKYVRSVLHKKYPWISAWYRPPTKIWNKESKREHFAKTFIIASMNLPCECLT